MLQGTEPSARRLGERRCEMNITSRFHGNCAILDLDGQLLSRADTMELRNAVSEAARNQPRRIILDMGKVSYIDSCGQSMP
jgi:anti-anti-sigma factor